MRLRCSNIGKLENADIEINTITVIAGLNSTGKSTVGKLLYCIFNVFHNFSKTVEATFKNIIKNLLLGNVISFDKLDNCIDELYKNRFCKDKEIIKKIITDYIGEFPFAKKNQTVLDSLISLLNMSDDEIYKRILQEKFYSEFGNQIQNIFSDSKKSEIVLTIKNEDIKVTIKNNKIYGINNFKDLNNEVIYIDNPFELDYLQSNRGAYHISDTNHRTNLLRKLFTDLKSYTDMDLVIRELLNENKFNEIYKLIDKVCKGNIVSDNSKGYFFHLEESNKNFNIENLSAGLKTFTIIKTLLTNGSLVDNGTIILDEPEIHLHPEWQKLLAEIIVLLQIKFSMHILINSHSPYFINAVDIYARKYKVRKLCKFYLAEDNSDNAYFSTIKDVSDNLEEINHLLFVPLQELENERAAIEEEGSDDND